MPSIEPDGKIGSSEPRSTVPFTQSPIDRLNDWIVQLRLHAAVIYLCIGLALVLVQVVFLLIEGGMGTVELLPVIIFNAFITPFLLGLIGFLDDRAVSAFESMQPVLGLDEDAYAAYRYAIANMPFRGAVSTGLAMLLVVILMEQVWILPARYAALTQYPVFAVVFQIVDKIPAFLYGGFFYHTIRQLRMVYAINTRIARINLFHLRPLQAFSRLTAATAVGLVVGVYGWMLINPELIADPVSIGFVALVTLAAAAAFVLPLFGVHRRIAAEKDRMLQALDTSLSDVFSRFNARLQEGEYASLEELNGVIASLETQRNRISAIPTWPWRPETAQYSLTAVVLPLLLWILRFLAERAFGA